MVKANELTPLTIRLNEGSVELLKKEARRVSFETNKDTSYVDIIRDAVQKYVSNIIDQNPEHSTQDEIPSIVVDSSSSSDRQWLNSVGRENLFNLLGIDLNNPVAIELGKLISVQLESSMPRAVLSHQSYVPDKKYPRSCATAVYVIEKRGAVSSEINWGESYTIPIFEIACNPCVKISDLDNLDLNNIASTSGSSLVKEEKYNFHTLLSSPDAIALSVEDNRTLTHFNTLSKGYDQLLEIGIIPRHMLLSPVNYSNLVRQGIVQGADFNFGPLRSDGGSCGNFQSAEIRADDCIPSDEIYFVGENAGYFVQKTDVQVLVNPEPTKLRTSFVVWIEIGMSLNDNCVSKIYVPKPKILRPD